MTRIYIKSPEYRLQGKSAVKNQQIAIIAVSVLSCSLCTLRQGHLESFSESKIGETGPVENFSSTNRLVSLRKSGSLYTYYAQYVSTAREWAFLGPVSCLMIYKLLVQVFLNSACFFAYEMFVVGCTSNWTFSSSSLVNSD